MVHLAINIEKNGSLSYNGSEIVCHLENCQGHKTQGMCTFIEHHIPYSHCCLRTPDPTGNVSTMTESSNAVYTSELQHFLTWAFWKDCRASSLASEKDQSKTNHVIWVQCLLTIKWQFNMTIMTITQYQHEKQIMEEMNSWMTAKFSIWDSLCTCRG